MNHLNRESHMSNLVKEMRAKYFDLLHSKGKGLSSRTAIDQAEKLQEELQESYEKELQQQRMRRLEEDARRRKKLKRHLKSIQSLHSRQLKKHDDSSSSYSSMTESRKERRRKKEGTSELRHRHSSKKKHHHKRHQTSREKYKENSSSLSPSSSPHLRSCHSWNRRRKHTKVSDSNDSEVDDIPFFIMDASVRSLMEERKRMQKNFKKSSHNKMH